MDKFAANFGMVLSQFFHFISGQVADLRGCRGKNQPCGLFQFLGLLLASRSDRPITTGPWLASKKGVIARRQPGQRLGNTVIARPAGKEPPGRRRRASPHRGVKGRIQLCGSSPCGYGRARSDGCASGRSPCRPGCANRPPGENEFLFRRFIAGKSIPLQRSPPGDNR